jgi:hypothetical protein
MDLNEFIEQTLFEIALGVQRAKVKSKDLVAAVPPRIDGEKAAEPSYVEFDVTVTAATSGSRIVGGGGKAAAKFRIAVVEAEIGVDGQADRSTSVSDQNTHRAAFKVPVHFSAHYRNDPHMPQEAEFLAAAYPRNEPGAGAS